MPGGAEMRGRNVALTALYNANAGTIGSFRRLDAGQG
jgi:hypothetical protein